VYGSERTFDDGTTAIADDAYLRKSIIDPTVQVIDGYPAAVMRQDYGDVLSEDEINGLIEYIKSLGE
jgi:cytochrome c oxidase subunit 2